MSRVYRSFKSTPRGFPAEVVEVLASCSAAMRGLLELQNRLASLTASHAAVALHLLRSAAAEDWDAAARAAAIAEIESSLHVCRADLAAARATIEQQLDHIACLTHPEQR